MVVAKLNPAGSALVYATYLGGSGDESGYAIAVEAGGAAYITGRTNSTDFPTQNPMQNANAGGVADAYVAKLDASGSALVYSTYLGGALVDLPWSIAVDGSGNAYVAGNTYSTDFPTKNPLQATNNGKSDGFVSKLNAAGSALVYSTFLGGTDGESASGIAVDASGNAYVAGDTFSMDFPTKNPLQGSFGGSVDAFVSKLNVAGSAFVYSTYLGGSDYDDGIAIAVDTNGNAYVAGETFSGDFPTHNALQATIQKPSSDAFVAKVDSAGAALVYSTYLGGSARDLANAIAVDGAGNAYAAGETSSMDFPTSKAPQSSSNGGVDAFVSEIDPAGASFVYSTYLGGAMADVAYGIALGSNGRAHVTGMTTSSGFATQGSLQSTFGGGAFDAWVSEIRPQLALGDACTTPAACPGGNCVDGVCCDSACGDSCAACDVMGRVGTCSPISGAPHGSRPACGGTAPCAGTCDGKSTSCTFPGSSVACGSSCSGGMETDKSCDGKGACAAGAPRSCNALVCSADGTKCKTSCANDADCVSPNVCDKTGQCVRPTAPPNPPGPNSAGGCSCDLGADGSAPWTAAPLAVALSLLVRRRRRRTTA